MVEQVNFQPTRETHKVPARGDLSTPIPKKECLQCGSVHCGTLHAVLQCFPLARHPLDQPQRSGLIESLQDLLGDAIGDQCVVTWFHDPIGPPLGDTA